MSDLINREQAMESVARHYHQETGCEGEWFAFKAIADLPSADRPQGEWIKDNLGTVICSECKRPRRDNRINHINFCNSCGCRMKGADDES